jgi:transcriptional regulator with XRE-family HTH domain
MAFMEEFSIIELKRMTDDMVIQAIGEYVRSARLERNLTQEQLGERAGVHRTTVRDLEWGKRSTLITLIQVLRSLDELQTLKHFKASKELNPLELAKLEAKERKRASRAKSTEQPETTDW